MRVICALDQSLLLRITAPCRDTFACAVTLILIFLSVATRDVLAQGEQAQSCHASVEAAVEEVEGETILAMRTDMLQTKVQRKLATPGDIAPMSLQQRMEARDAILARRAATEDPPVYNASTDSPDIFRLRLPEAEQYRPAVDGWETPLKISQYEGLEDKRRFPSIWTDSAGEMHVFAIGDWGGYIIDNPRWWHGPRNHYTMPNSRYRWGKKRKCPDQCGYNWDIDPYGQLFVAEAMKERAQWARPQYVVNVGDNAYPGGVDQDCTYNWLTEHGFSYFDEGWYKIYEDIAKVPWISCLGNHDYGGWLYHSGWTQQIKYSFVNRNWVMPARYYKRSVRHADYTVDYFVFDTNALDARDPAEDPDHNICSSEHSYKDYRNSYVNCEASGGPSSPWDCEHWFHSQYETMKQWLVWQLGNSSAHWKIAVTHFPCGHEWDYYTRLHNDLGLDFLITGHRHDQEIHPVGHLPCIVTGGGGGVTSEAQPRDRHSNQYGFFDLTFSRDTIKVELVALDGAVIQSGTVVHGAVANEKYTNAYNVSDYRNYRLGAGPSKRGGQLENEATFKQATPLTRENHARELTDGMDPAPSTKKDNREGA